MDASSGFRDFEHAGWEGAAEAYAEHWGALTSQSVGPLLDAVGAGPGVTLLDVASGPGYVAAAAAARGARATGVDFSAVMVAAAQRRYPRVTFREGEADALPFPDATFDAVTIAYGLLHFERPDQALAEAYRVLRPGGRVAFTVWATPDQAVGFDIILRAVQAHGDPDVALPPAPPFFRFSDAAECRRALEAVGFRDATVGQLPQVWRLDSPDQFFAAMQHGTVRTAGLLRAQTPAALAAIGAAVRAAGAAYQHGATLEVPMPAVLARAVKPG
ncbi:MAG TPA: methyltransferase domain-containing protein [Chloroflexota bacterium]|nr:methyltransferase domain-containing protein [Chloroflexota bacterium]